MKNILLSSAIAAAALTPVTAESFSGMFAAGKGSVLIYNKSDLSDLTKDTLDKELKSYGGFGLKGFAGGVELGYSFRFANNFIIGASLGGAYNHHSIKEESDKEAGNDKKKLGLDFVSSGLVAEARLRLGMAYKRFHVYVNPGIELAMSNPELTVKYKGADGKEASHKITFAKDKGPEWKERLSFVMGLNAEYALTQTMFVGGGIGIRYGFSDVKDQKANFSEDTLKVVNEADSKIADIGYKSPFGVEINLIVGASF
jgi:opacity protein-like surface antigen